MPLPPPQPLARDSLCNQQMAASPPPAPVSFGTVRAAALAARQARQLRLKRLQQQPPSGYSDQLRGASPPASYTTPSTRHAPFHEKKNLKLQLNLDVVAKPEGPPMFASSVVGNQPMYDSPVEREEGWTKVRAHSSEELPWEAMEDEELAPAKRPPAYRPRRQSSVTMSLNTPEGAEFEEVANDGPEQLGKFTKRIKRLGKGAGGVVFLSLYLPALKLVAVKEVVVYKEQERELVKHELHALHENLVPIDSPAATSPQKPREGAWSEWRHRLTNVGKPHSQACSVSSAASCPYLVAFYGAYLLPAKCAISIAMEFMDMGSLQDLLDARVSIPEQIVRHAAFCCMTALEHMHRHRMIHRDIKPANILMNRKGEFKIADFGLAGTLSKSESFFSEFEGTMMYMAPERIQGQPYSYVSDVWSMGVSLFYLATGSYPFAVEDGFFGLEEAIVNDPLPPMPNRFSSECRDFVKGLMRRDPAKRLTAAQALAHPFLTGYDQSDAFRTFPSLWSKMPLSQGPIQPEDVATIAQLLADFAQRQTRRQSRRLSSRGLAVSTTPPSFFSHFTQIFTSSPTNAGQTNEQLRQEALERLAQDCGAGGHELERLLERAIARQ